MRRPSTGAPPSDHPVIDSRDLLRGQREILIRHGDREYRLRHTRNDKLILTL
ncbi:MAG TPA: hemin uptake protein HemP [Chiayiivirga sp.]|uniref:Hemin uptake protein HemP n=1 Tax=Denitratimonas tolerans TaxID=1338420 RepID=A0AAW9R6T6_9GAMM|nr:hemin uptake protein HemP [Xanthomonadaceae bacterium]MDX9764320.1 hemin uptake protein HemP [Chiayiivirga sp.]HMN35372.1 hemin uptake protein HemP [Chiayiivirga sp.]HRN59038.1 hemin uptake protein HemP [Chiayiivirga sp.]HRQ34844.1 hemin uptake protein HemP [Chiayiivirga sp.]